MEDEDVEITIRESLQSERDDGKRVQKMLVEAGNLRSADFTGMSSSKNSLPEPSLRIPTTTGATIDESFLIVVGTTNVEIRPALRFHMLIRLHLSPRVPRYILGH